MALDLEALASKLGHDLGLADPPPLLGRDIALILDALRSAAAEGEKAGYQKRLQDEYAQADHYRKMSDERVAGYGLEPRMLQVKWRNPATVPDTYDMNEVNAAICDALNHEGIPAWSGDATSCVDQIVKAVWDKRAEVGRREGKIEGMELAAKYLDGIRIGDSPPGARPLGGVYGDLIRALIEAERTREGKG